MAYFYLKQGTQFCIQRQNIIYLSFQSNGRLCNVYCVYCQIENMLQNWKTNWISKRKHISEKTMFSNI